MKYTPSRHLVIALILLVCGACERTEQKRPELGFTRTIAFDPQRIAEPFGIAAVGNDLVVSDGENGRILRIGKDGSIAVVGEGLGTPSQIAAGADGEIFFADSGTHTIRKINRSGTVETVAGTDGKPGFRDGTAAEAQFRAPVGIAVAGSRIYVADTYNDRIRVIENGAVQTLAGGARGFADSNDASKVKFDTPTGLAVGLDGSILVCDTGNARIRALRGNGSTVTLIGGGKEFGDGSPHAAGLYQPSAVAVAPDGTIYFTDGNVVRKVDLATLPFIRTISNERRGFADGARGDSSFNRPNGIAVLDNGDVAVADSENQAVRVISSSAGGRTIKPEEIEAARVKAEQFRTLAPARWPYAPPENTREIAGTLGEIRGENDGTENIWFHNGLDIVGGYGETARFVRDEKVTRTVAAENFGTLRELLRMPTLGYIHIRLGRDSSGKAFDDPRFVFDRSSSGEIVGVRVPRGASFKAGDAIGTLNPMNHVHLIAGRSGFEMNALAALDLPGVSDKIPPTVEAISLYDENWRELETETTSKRITVVGKSRIVARAYDRMDGNAERRRLGIYKIGYQLLKPDKTPIGDVEWTIRFDTLPAADAVGLVYAKGSKSGATGETIFRYTVTDRVSGGTAVEGFLDAGSFEPGEYVLRVVASDYFGNETSKDQPIEIRRQ